ncbi:hypothetical protein [Peribacillus sp. SCS-155]
MSEKNTDYQAENMTDLVQLINTNNNSGKMKKIIDEHKKAKEQKRKEK